MNSNISDINNNLENILVIGDVFFVQNDIQKLINLVRNELKDFTVLANLEGSINFANNKSKKLMSLSLPMFDPNDMPQNLYFSVVNNHVTDYGIDNFLKNIKYLENKVVY